MRSYFRHSSPDPAQSISPSFTRSIAIALISAIGLFLLLFSYHTLVHYLVNKL